MRKVKLSNNLFRKIYDNIKSNENIVLESEKVIKQSFVSNNIQYLYVIIPDIYNITKIQNDKIKDKIYTASTKKITRLSHFKNYNGPLAIIKYNPPAIQNFNKSLLINNLQDPGNMGTIFRLCLAFNIQNIYINSESVHFLNHKVIRGSMGAIFQLNIVDKINIKQIVMEFKENNIPIITSVVKNGENLRKFKKKFDKFLLVIGNESKGIDSWIIDKSDIKLTIPISDKIDSLNVAAATAILLWELEKRRTIVL